MPTSQPKSAEHPHAEPTIAVIIPCYQEELTIGRVVADFKRELPEGSFSKLSTFSDGFAVILKLFLILRSHKPLTFFGLCSIGLLVLGFAAGARPVYEYITVRYVFAVPSAVLAASLVLLSFLSLGLGLILNSTNLRLLELKKLICKRPARRGSNPER